MSEQRDDKLSPEAERARNALRRLSPEPASPAFRARLKNDFVSGQITSVTETAPGGSRFNLGLRPRWIALPAAALLAVAFLLLNRGPVWEISALDGAGWVVVDGERVSLAAAEGLAGLLRPGAHVQTEADARVDLLLPGRILLEITPESDVVLPTTPGRWWGKTIRGRVEWGEMLFATGAEFPGHRFLVRTPEARVEVTGTSVSVFRAEMGTCVCVDTGTAMIGTGPGDMEPVPAGRRKVLPRDGAPFLDAIAAPHEEHIREFTARAGSKLAER